MDLSPRGFPRAKLGDFHRASNAQRLIYLVVEVFYLDTIVLLNGMLPFAVRIFLAIDMAYTTLSHRSSL